MLDGQSICTPLTLGGQTKLQAQVGHVLFDMVLLPSISAMPMADRSEWHCRYFAIARHAVLRRGMRHDTLTYHAPTGHAKSCQVMSRVRDRLTVEDIGTSSFYYYYHYHYVFEDIGILCCAFEVTSNNTIIYYNTLYHNYIIIYHKIL